MGVAGRGGEGREKEGDGLERSGYGERELGGEKGEGKRREGEARYTGCSDGAGRKFKELEETKKKP